MLFKPILELHKFTETCIGGGGGGDCPPPPPRIDDSGFRSHFFRRFMQKGLSNPLIKTALCLSSAKITLRSCLETLILRQTCDDLRCSVPMRMHLYMTCLSVTLLHSVALPFYTRCPPKKEQSIQSIFRTLL